MDDANRQKYLTPYRDNLSSWGVVLFFLFTIAGCLASQALSRPTPSPAAFAALGQDIAQFRGLPLKRDVTLTNSTADLGQALTYGPFEIEQIERAYRSIGLLPNDSDLGNALVEFRRLEQLVLYDVANGSVMLSPQATLLGAPFESTDPAFARAVPLLFGIVAALQEQHFQWQEKLNRIFLDDQRLAHRALAVGDAALTLVARSAGKSKGNLSRSELASAGKIGTALEKAAAHLPDFLRRQLIFPFREGSQFVFWALTAQGWPGVNGLYAKPPLSSAQVIHPEKYFVTRSALLRLFPAALLRQLKETPVIEQSLGEYLVRVLLASELPSTQATAIATLWRGDQLFAFQDNGSLGTAWFTAWTSDTTAVEFVRAYRTVLEKRQRVRFDSTAGRTANSFTGTTRDGRGVTLQARGTVAFLLSGVSTSRLSQVTEESWQDLEVEADPTDLRFDLGKRQNDKHARQLSLSSR